MSFLARAAAAAVTPAAVNFKYIMSIFGSRSTTDTPTPSQPELKKIQEKAKEIKSGVDAPPSLDTSSTSTSPKNTIPTLNAKNDSILASAATVLTPSQMDTFATNSVQIDDALEIIHKPTETQYKEHENKLFQTSLAAFMTHQRDDETYINECKAGVTEELTDMLMRCFIDKDEPIESHKEAPHNPASIYSRCAELAKSPLSSVSQFTDSWLPGLKRSGGDENETFFKRTAGCLQALRAYTIFESVYWRLYKRSQSIPPMPGGTPGGPADYGYDLRAIFQPYGYVIGPIVDFESLEGRTLIYVKCYDDETYTTGVYFWVYLSQSEGLFRVFFKLLANSIIEKGFDYTQGTLVNFMLQCLLIAYYNRHYSLGKQTPIKINSLERVVYFVEHMPYLQSNFLTKFPQSPLPSPAQSQCYVTPTPGQPGYVGHYYLIDKKYNSIFHNGFPLTRYGYENIFGTVLETNPSPDYFFWKNLQTSNPNLFLDVYRPLKEGYTHHKTEPLIYCFTTSCPKTIITSFTDLLNVMNYTATVWFQGLQNFTRIFGILSPVLYIVMGSMVERPDFELSSYRYAMMGTQGSTTGDSYKNSLNMLVTLGTEQLDGTTLYLPGISTLPRKSAVQGLKQINPRQTFERRKDIPTDEEYIASQQELVQEKAIQVCEELTKSGGLLAPLDTSPGYMVKYQQYQEALIKQISDFGLLSIKREWFFRKFNASYEALGSVFPMEHDETINVGMEGVENNVPKITLYCLCKNCKFLPLPNLNCLDPTDTRLLTLTSQFNETRRDHTSGNLNEVNVIVLTLSQHYCMEVKYNKLDSRGHSEIRTMCRLIQVSSTIVYKSGDPEKNKILFSIDMQQTPIACFPDYIIETTTEEDVLAYIRHYGQGGGTLPKGANTRPVAPPKSSLVKTAVQSDAEATRNPSSASLKKPQAVKVSRSLATPIRRPDTNADDDDDLLAQEAAEHEQQEHQAAEEHQRQMAQATKVLSNLKLVLESKMTLFLTPKRVASWGSFFSGKMMDYLFGPYFQLPSIFKQFEQYLQVCHPYYTTALIYNYNTARPDSFLVVKPAFSFVGMFDAHFGTSFVPPEPGLTAAQYIGRRLRENTDKIKQIARILTAQFMDDHDIDDVSVASSATSSATSNVASSASSSFPAARQLLGDSLRTDSSDATFNLSQYLGSQDDSMGSNGTADGGTLPIKYHIKKSITTRKNKNKPRTKSRTPVRRITIRIKRMMKSKFTKPKTYKRRATGGKRKSKPNKTMRRYRRVRK